MACKVEVKKVCADCVKCMVLGSEHIKLNH